MIEALQDNMTDNFTPIMFMPVTEALALQYELCSCLWGRHFVDANPDTFWRHDSDCPAHRYGHDFCFYLLDNPSPIQ